MDHENHETLATPAPPATVPVSDPQAKVQDIINWDSWARGALSEDFKEGIDHWKLYLSSRKDHRKPWEKTWRAHTLQPYPFVIIEGAVAATVDVITAADPLMQVDGVGDEDADIARKSERLMDLTFRQNQWRLKLEELEREKRIQGTAAIKLVWRHDTARVRKSDPDAEAAFDSELDAARQMGIEVPDDPNEYEAFRKEFLEQEGVPLPANPRSQFNEVTTFKGPSFERVALTDLRYDPMEGDWSKQRRRAQIIIRPQKWVMDRAGSDPSLPFRRKECEEAINAMPGDAFNEYIQQIADMQGVGAATTGYYGRKDLCILTEVFDPEDEEMPWKVVLNDLKIINKDPFPPYGHGECPIHLFRNIPKPGFANGMSELKAPKKLFEELWALRDLRLDGVVLATLPIFVRLQELGIPEVSRILRPGTSITLPRLDALQTLKLGGVHPDVWREIDTLKAEIDDTTSVSTQMRGQAATVGRVSASEAERRFSSAMLRMKTAAVRFEEELRRPMRQVLYLWYAHGGPETLLRVGGQGTDGYPASITREELLQALDYDFNFRGPSRAFSNEMRVQQMMQWFTSFGALIPIHRQLAFAKQTYEIMGLKGRNEVLPDSDIASALAAAQAPPPAPVDPATGQPIAPAGTAPAPAEAGQDPAAQGMPAEMGAEMPPEMPVSAPGEAPLPVAA